MGTIKNPILKGFNPDPCITKGHDGAWYIAVSTFEWYPGVYIYRSENFGDWELAAAPLDRLSQLNLIGGSASSGIWAPALSYSDGLYWLIYTNTKTWKNEPKVGAPFRDMYNYVVTAPTIEGPWSEPSFLTGGGYDPSLFHDDDGRKYLLWSHRDFRHTDQRLFEGLVLQEFDPGTRKLISEQRVVYEGANVPIDYYYDVQLYEGAYIYKRNGYYYIISAEGGPGYSHSSCVSRSTNIWGPYDLHPEQIPVLTAYQTDSPIQKTGHGNICEGPDGRDYITYLCSRPLPGKRKSPLGRESGMAPLEWFNDWPYLAGFDRKGNNPPLEFEIEGVNPKADNREWNIKFSEYDKLPLEFQALRIPITSDWCSLNDERPGYLRLKGKDSPVSRFNQSVLARRIQHFNFEVETRVEFDPLVYDHFAGLMLRYDESLFYYLIVTFFPETGEKVLAFMEMEGSTFNYIDKITVLDNSGVCLKAITVDEKITFYWSPDGKDWNECGIQRPFDRLCDENAEPVGFTGSFVGISANDMTGFKRPADFEYFSYSIL
jgi:xylan 1,4-beta-xylosidase